MAKAASSQSPASPARSREGHVTGAEEHLPKSARKKSRTTLVTRKTGTGKPTPRKR